MIKVTRWRPDTCKCCIDFEWDDALPEDLRLHTVHEVINRCPAHAGIADGAKLYWVVLDENQRKNNVFGMAVQRVAFPPDPSLYQWSFDLDRNLRVRFVGMIAQRKLALQAELNTQYGVGKVVVE